MAEAMRQIKLELGNEAVILSNKEIKKGGFFGLFQKKFVEVVAAQDTKPLGRQHIAESPKIVQPIIKETKDSEVLAEIKQLRTMIISQQSTNVVPADFQSVYDYLINQDVNEILANELVEYAVSLREANETYSIKHLVTKAIEEKFAHIDTPGISYKKQIIQFVGPTGVGKTTTLAKVAAHSMLHHDKKIVFITADTYRIAAIDQLKTYARILNVPIEVAYSKEDYQAALDKYKDYDLIFVDTAGRNFRDERYIDELRSTIDMDSHNVETYLVMSLTAKERDINEIFSRFKPLHIEKVIFTKLDETATYGNILNICLPEQINLAYLTNGQDVPDDIIEPDRAFIGDLMMRRYEDD